MAPACGLEGRLGDGVDEALARRLGLIDLAIFEQDGEFIAGVARDEIIDAEIGAQPSGEADDDLVAHVIAVGAVEREQILERDQQNSEGLARFLRLAEQAMRMVGDLHAAHRSGQRVDLGAPRQLEFELLAVGDDADEAVSAPRATVAAGEPATAVLHPDERTAAALTRRHERVDGAVGHAVAFVASRQN